MEKYSWRKTHRPFGGWCYTVYVTDDDGRTEFCECFCADDAQKICDALNKNEEGN